MKVEQVNAMSFQEQLDYVIDNLIAQGERCMGGYGRCSYGNGKGQHCAVGWLLDESNKDLMAYGASVISLIGSEFKIPDTLRENIELWDRVQWVHDNALESYRRDSVEALRQKFPDITFDGRWDKWVELGKPYE